MQEIVAKGIQKEQFKAEFAVKPHTIPRIDGEPTYTMVRPIRKAVETNLIGMKDDREPVYGRLHLIDNTGNLPNGRAVVASVNQGQPIAAQEALKDFIIEVFDNIYLWRLKHSRLGYKNVTLLQFMNLLRDDF